MIRVGIKNLLAHKRRLSSTLTAVVLGVGFLAGVLVLSATINQSFNDLFGDANRGTDVYVRAHTSLQTTGFNTRPQIDPAVLDQVARIDGVEHAELAIDGLGQIVNASGKAVGIPDRGPPTFASNWKTDERLNPYKLAEGRAPARDGEVVINRQAATDGGIHVGDQVTVTLREPAAATVVGLATFGTAESSGGSTYVAFATPTALRLIGEGKADGVKVVARPGMSQDELVTRIARDLPPGLEAITGTQLTQESVDAIQGTFLRFLTTFLTMFAVIAVIVSVFSIYNTFAILVAQRTREMALLRAIGASRGQVLRSVLFEAVILGVVGAALGLGVGVGLSQVLKGMLAAFGVSPPSSGVVITVGSMLVPFLVGLAVTVLAGVLPAVKATRVPPVASMRDVSVERTRPTIVRIALGAILTLAGVATVINAVMGDASNATTIVGLGTFVTLVGVVVSGPVAAGPVGRLLGAPVAKLRGISGVLARQNATRHPRRTAGTASALMIGVAVVALFTVFAASITTTVNEQIDASFAGDLVVGGAGFGPGRLSPDLAGHLADLPEVASATGIGKGIVAVDGEVQRPTIADPTTLTQVLDVGVTAGSLGALGATQIAVADTVAKEKGWTVGSTVSLSFIDGTTAPFTVGAVYHGAGVVGPYLVSRTAWAPHASIGRDSLVALRLEPGVSAAAGRAAVEPVVARIAAGTTVQDRQAFRDAQSAGINTILGLIYALLALAIIISLMGIGNTLSLSINERIRELGVLRAVGMTRAQLRSSIRWESVVIALFGTLGGLALGVFSSWALVRAAGEVTYAVPVPNLVVLVVLGALAGVLAAVRPARRAARIDVLAAVTAL